MIEEDFRAGKFVCRIIRSSLAYSEGISGGKYGGEEIKTGIGSPVIFLHGYAFTSDIWREINVLEHLIRNDIPYVAVDMPYGKKSKCTPHTGDFEPNLTIVKELASKFDNPPVLVGASLGGTIALRYSIDYPVNGLLLIAPARALEKELIEKYGNGHVNIPIRIIYGTKDSLISKQEMIELSKLLNAELEVYEGAKHPAYLDFPDRFKKDLLELYGRTRSAKPD